MMEVDPSRDQFPEILNKIRSELDVSGRPEWYRYIINKTEGHSKYHYFFIFKDRAKHVGGNANGRIGYPPLAVHITHTSEDFAKVLDIVSKKYQKKVASKEYVDITEEL
jgi:hypothetical protein